MMTSSEFNELVRSLELHHGIFSQLWQMGKPVEDKSIPTACVRFDRKGDYFGFCFNPDFYRLLDPYTVKFIVCHECLHVILNHGVRARGHIADLSNKALDVVVNEMLVSKFGFDRSLVKFANEWCWLDTVFPNDPQVEKNKSYEYYYQRLLSKQPPQQSAAGESKSGSGTPQAGSGPQQPTPPQQPTSPRPIDTHSTLTDEEQGDVDDKLDEACDRLSDKEIDQLVNVIEKELDDQTKAARQAGTSAGNLVKTVEKLKVKKKRKWETVIKRWSEKYLNHNSHDQEQWARINRRFVTLSTSGLFIPTEMEIDTYVEKKNRIKVMFFLDTSGSCAHLATRFWKAAASLPENRFDVRLACFDTQVYETTIESRKLYGFGGTSFRAIEAYIQRKIAQEKESYPRAVFVITDGYGDSVSPKNPQNWYWFLSENYLSYIPKQSKVFNLKDYE